MKEIFSKKPLELENSSLSKRSLGTSSLFFTRKLFGPKGTNESTNSESHALRESEISAADRSSKMRDDGGGCRPDTFRPTDK